MLTSIYQGGLPHLQISRILLLHQTPLQRKNNNNNKNNKQKQTYKHTKVRLCHVLNGRPLPLVLALMRIKCTCFSLEWERGSVQWEVSRPQKLRNFLLFRFFWFWNPSVLVTWQKVSVIRFGAQRQCN